MTTASIGVGGSPAPVPDQAVALRPTRVLAPWLSDQEAINHVLGRGPMPQDDLTGVNQTLTLARAAVQMRPVFVPGDPVVQGDRTVLDAFAARPDVQADFTDVPWRVEMVDLTRVQAVQKMVFTDRLALETNGLDLQALIELCLPAGQPTAPFAIATDQDSITVSSANPNLRVVSGQVYPTLAATAPNLPPRQVQAVTFLVTTSTSYVQVAHYQGRYFLRDGNHRAAALLRAGITRVPAVVIEAPSFQFVAPPPLGLFDYQVAFGDRPPLVTDFWDASVAADGRQPATYKVVRVSAAQFPVPIHV